MQIAAHEAAHVENLSNTLGASATKPCNYSLYVFFIMGLRRELMIFFSLSCLDSPYNDVKSFISLSQIFEGVGEFAYFISFTPGRLHFYIFKSLPPGTSAYTGATRYLSWQYVTTSGRILATEASQASWISTLNKGQPWGSSFEVSRIRPQIFYL